MLLRVLGPLELVGGDGSVAIGAAKPRTLLAALAIERGRTCTADALVDALWGESPPSSAPKLLQVYVSLLRKTLPTGVQIVTSTAGYTLEVEAREVDAAVFERLVADARAARRAANPALAATTLARALALWRGPAYADVRYEEFALDEIERLERLREVALEERFDADLELGRHAEVLGELRGLLAADATREGIARRAMLAAYRTTGPDEAIALFDLARETLERELGAGPGVELIDLRDRILARDPSLDAEASPASGSRLGPPLPAAPNELIGRRQELADLRALLGRPDVRLVSLTGAGGSGKSRLALELARDLDSTYANGAAYVELASITDPELVLATIAGGLGLDPGRDARATLEGALADREILLVLDNLEHLRAAAPQLVRLLAAASHLTIVATTRVVLHVSGEHVFPVAPLAEADAVSLFADRARAREPAFRLDDATEPVVVSICRRLDGLPLAIELAAAKTRGLGLSELERRLASRLTTLTGGPRDLPARQQTLRATIDWSFGLLSDDERELLARLSVFRGGFDLAAAAAVVRPNGEDALHDIVERLVDASLLVPQAEGGSMRYRLLETVREYASERLATSSEQATAQQAHAALYASLALAAAIPIRGGPDGPEWLERLAPERDNLRAALAWLRDAGDHTALLRVTGALWWYWWVRAEATEGRTWLQLALEGPDTGDPEAEGLRGEALLGLAGLSWSEGDLEAAAGFAARAEALFAEAGDDASRGRAWNTIGLTEHGRHNLSAAVAAFDRSIELYRSADMEPDRRATTLATALDNRASVALEAGDVAAAVQGYEEARSVYESGHPGGETAMYDLHLGHAAVLQGRHADAAPLLARALEHYRGEGFLQYTTECLEVLAWVANGGRQHREAAMLLGAASSLRERTRTPMWGRMREEIDRQAATARAALGESAYQGAREKGRADPEAAIELAVKLAAAVRPGTH